MAAMLSSRLSGATLLAALLAALLAPSCSSAATVSRFGSWQPTIAASAEIAALERAMADLVNRDRAARGLAPLSFDARLADVARGHSLDMRVAGFFGHLSPTTGSASDRLDHAGYIFTASRENLALADDVDAAQSWLLDSPRHHANIMADDVSHMGVGIVTGRGDDREVLTITAVRDAGALRLPSESHRVGDRSPRPPPRRATSAAGHA